MMVKYFFMSQNGAFTWDKKKKFSRFNPIALFNKQ